MKTAMVTQSGQALGTNQIAELNAVLQALRNHRNVAHPILQTDSTYARDCSTTWRRRWERSGMRNSKKKPVAYREIIMAIWEALDARTGTVEFVKVPGHDPDSKFPLNTAADISANSAAEQAQAGRSFDEKVAIDLARVKPRPTSFGR